MTTTQTTPAFELMDWNNIKSELILSVDRKLVEGLQPWIRERFDAKASRALRDALPMTVFIGLKLDDFSGFTSYGEPVSEELQEAGWQAVLGVLRGMRRENREYVEISPGHVERIGW